MIQETISELLRFKKYKSTIIFSKCFQLISYYMYIYYIFRTHMQRNTKNTTKT